MLAVSCGWLEVEVNCRAAGTRPLGFTTAAKEKQILTSQTTTEYESAGGEAQNSPPNVYLIDFRPRNEAQLHIHTRVKVFAGWCLHNSTWRIVKSHPYEAASDQRRGKCFNMFRVRVRFYDLFECEQTSNNCLIPEIFFFLFLSGLQPQKRSCSVEPCKDPTVH